MTRGEYRGGNAGARGPGIQIFEDTWSRSDYLLAAAQTCLAFVCLAATYLEPPPLDWHLPTLRLMFLFYIAFSLLVVFLIRVMSRVAKSLEVPIHVVGVLWVSGISLATGRDGSPFFLVFIALLLISAAYRWGLHWTVATAAVCITLGFLGQLVARLWMPAFAPRLPGNWGWSGFVLEVAALLVLGFAVGLLGEEHQRSRSRAKAIGRFVEAAGPEAGMRQTVEMVLRGVTELFGARKALLTIDQKSTGKTFLFEVANPPLEEQPRPGFWEVGEGERAIYSYGSPGEAWYGQLGSQPQTAASSRFLALSEDGRKLRRVESPLSSQFFNRHPLKRLFSVPFSYAEEWSGRLFLLDPEARSNRRGDLRFLSELIAEICPAVCAVYSLRRVRSRVREVERARVAHELHDGVIQSLVALDMHLEMLARRAGSDPGADEVRRLQDLLREGIVSTRELMQGLKPLQIDPTRVVQHLADLVNKFQRETGIAASFAAACQEVRLPPRVCHELVRVVQEALVNVRKHSAARRVQVTIGGDNGQCRVMIGDDGRGFGFSGRLSLDELDAAHMGPAVIKERLRSVGGDLVVESVPGRGASLVIRVPADRYA